MTQTSLLFLGFGNVGQALAKLLETKRTSLKNNFDIEFIVTGIATGSHGRAINHQGINLSDALEKITKGDSLNSLSTTPAPDDNLAFIRASNADVLFENTPVSYSDGQPAIEHIRTALQAGMHVSTANKGPVVHGYDQLTSLAQENNKRFYFESTVMDGAPVFSLLRVGMPAAEISGIRGVLNSTTNLMLSRMEDGESFDQAVTFAQSIGIAETDPSGDVDGWDAAIKISALITVYMEKNFTPDMVDRKGIRDISPEKIEEAKNLGKRWKLVCSAWREGDEIKAKVAPVMIGPDSPLFTVDGTTSIVQIESDVLGKLSLIENDPGPHTTAYGLLADFINAMRN